MSSDLKAGSGTSGGFLNFIVSADHTMAIWLALIIHFVADLALVVLPWYLGITGELVVAGLLLGQVSLIALWAAGRTERFYFRFAAAAAGTLAVWLVFVRLLQGFSMAGAFSAAWATAMATQAVLIMILAMAGRLVWTRLAPLGSDRDTQPLLLQYSILSLLVWTAIVALALGLFQTFAEPLGWDAEVLRWEFFRLMPVIGLYNALYALLAIASLAMLRKRTVAVVLAGMLLVLLAPLACSQSRVLKAFFGSDGGIGFTGNVILAGSQVAVLYATLAPLRFCGVFANRRPAAEAAEVPE